MDLNILPKLQIPKINFSHMEWPSFDMAAIRWSKMPKLKIGNSVSRLPIIQGGMGVGISLSGLASAVANEGGIGVIAANSIGMLDPEYYATHKDANARVLKKEIKKTKAKTSGIIGVNIMVAVHDFHALLRVAIEEKVHMVFLGAGLPIKDIPVKDFRSAGVSVIPIVSSSRAAGLIFKSWSKRYDDIPDAVVVEGPEAGGHLGFTEDQIGDPEFDLQHLLPGVVREIKKYEGKFHKTIPVIAAGGIFTGTDISNVFKLGASGVQMGTRFVATHECDADRRFKETYISCSQKDIGIIKSPVGMPGRAIKNSFLENIASGKKMDLKCAWRCLKSCDIKTAPYCITLALDNARKGIMENGFAFAGSNAYRVDKIIAVKELLQELQMQYLKAEEKGAGRLRNEYENAIEKLTALKKEYLETLKTGLNAIKGEYAKGVSMKLADTYEDYTKITNKINSLKKEYAKAMDHANRLKEELAKFFEQYALFNKPQVKGA